MEEVAAVPTEDQVRFASPVVVKRTKTSYGKAGILILTDSKLVFAASEPAYNWEIARTSITDLKKPWYGMGSYMTFKVNGDYYALAFGKRGPNVPASVGNLALRYGGSIGLQTAAVADAMAVAQLRDAAKIGGAWWQRLNARA